MLKINRSISLSGVSMIEGQQVVHMSATISTDAGSNGSTTRTIYSKELYDANKVEIRKDLDEFDKAVYKIEDELAANKDIVTRTEVQA
ncbi:hypothetical protein JCM1393_25510 [Clostridium carnis]